MIKLGRFYVAQKAESRHENAFIWRDFKIAPKPRSPSEIKNPLRHSASS